MLGKNILHHKFYEKANGESFLDFLKSVHKKFGKCVLFLDNANYHKSYDVRDGMADFGDDVVLEFFLPYTPELNPIEVQWRTQKRCTANRIYEDIDEMQESITRMYATGEIKPVKMHDYLVT